MYKYLSILVIFFTILSCKNRDVSSQDVQEPEKVVGVEKAEIEDVIINPLLKEHFKWVRQDVECGLREEFFLFYGFSFLKVNDKDLIYIGPAMNPPVVDFNPEDPDYSFAKSLKADKQFIGFKEYDDFCLLVFNSLPDSLFNGFIDISKLNRDTEYLYSIKKEESPIYDGYRYTSEIYSPERLIFIEKKHY